MPAPPLGIIRFDAVKFRYPSRPEMSALDGISFDKLPIDAASNKVSEDTNVGETGDPNLTPGETRSFSVDLTPGTYVLVCNIEKHYGLGMRSLLTVTP